MKPNEIDDFLKQYGTSESAQPTFETKPQITNNESIDQFLNQYESKTQQPNIQAEQPTITTNGPNVPENAPPPLTPEQQRQLTHKPPTVMKELKIRPKYLREKFKAGFADFAALPGYAVDALNWPLYKLGLNEPDKYPWGGSQQIRMGWNELLQTQQMEPQSIAERYAGASAQFLGSSLIPSAALTKVTAARGILPSATSKAATIRKAFQIRGNNPQLMRLEEPATTIELAAIIGTEAASAVTGGIGAEVGGEVGQELAGEPGRIAGSLIGGFAAGAPPYYFKSSGSLIYNAKKQANGILKQRETVLENAAKAKIMQAIGEDPNATANIERAATLETQIPGFKANLAAAIDSPGLVALQHQLDRASIENYNRATESIRKAQQSIDNYYQQNFGLTPGKLPAQKMFKQTLFGLKKQATEIDKQISDLTARFERQPTEAIGRRLRELRQIRKTQIRGNVDQAYKDLYKAADDNGVVDDASDIYLLAQNFIRQDSTVFQDMPRTYRKIMDIVGREIDPDVNLADQKIMTSFEKLHSLYKQTAKEYGQAQKAGDATKQFYLGQLKELLDSKLTQFDDPIYGTFANHKRAVDEYWLNEYHNVFRKGVGGKIPNETRWGQVTPDEKIVSNLVMQQGTARGINEFNKLYENIPEAQTLLRNGILDMFSSQVINKGKIDERSVRVFLNNYKEVFDQIPDLRNTFMNADAISTALANRQVQIIRKTKLFSNKTVSPYAEIAGFNDPHAAVQAGLQDNKIMRILTRNSKTKTEKEQLTNIIADVVLEQPDPWQFLLKHEKELASHFNQLKPGHFQKLKNIAESQKILERYEPQPPMGTTATQEPFYKKFGTTFASALAQWRWALLYNKTSVYYPAADMGAKYLNKIKTNKVDELLERALYDPDLATTISELKNVKPMEMGSMKALSVLNKMGLHAINNGIRNTVYTANLPPAGNEDIPNLPPPRIQ